MKIVCFWRIVILIPFWKKNSRGRPLTPIPPRKWDTPTAPIPICPWCVGKAYGFNTLSHKSYHWITLRRCLRHFTSECLMRVRKEDLQFKNKSEKLTLYLNERIEIVNPLQNWKITFFFNTEAFFQKTIWLHHKF